MDEHHLSTCLQPAPESLLKGIDQFNHGEYFECHETLEDLWVAERGPVRELYQGLLQVAVALRHRERGNFGGAVSLCRKGVGHMQGFSPCCQGVQVGRLIAETERLREALEELGPERIRNVDHGLIPRVHLLVDGRGEGAEF